MAFEPVNLTMVGDAIGPHEPTDRTDDHSAMSKSTTLVAEEASPGRIGGVMYKRMIYSPGRHTADGEHQCGGMFRLIRTTAEVQVLLCTNCQLRIEMPARIATYGELRAHFNNVTSRRGRPA